MSRGRRNVNLVAPEETLNPPVGPRIELEFRRHNPPTFNGEGDPLEAERWVRALEKIFGFLQCTDRERISCALYQLVDDADFWWESVRRTIPDDEWEMFTWEDFKTTLYEKFIPTHYQHQKANEFWNLKQGSNTVAEYDQQFNRLARYAPQTVDTEEKRIEKFRMGLKPEIGATLIGRDEASYGKILSWALSIEAMQRTSKAQTSQPTTSDHKGKRKWDDRNQGEYQENNFQASFQGERYPIPRTVWQGEATRRPQGYRGTAPFCETCNKHHSGPCIECFQCGRQGHYAKNCPQNFQNPGRQGSQQPRPQFRPPMGNMRPQGELYPRNEQRGNPRPHRNYNLDQQASQPARAYALNQQDATQDEGM